MRIQCDVCTAKEAVVFCTADEAALCQGCDKRVHQANKLANKHDRFSLISPNSSHFSNNDNANAPPLCDICQERRAFLFCREDRAIVCRECDIVIHNANEHIQNHSRFLLTGVRVRVIPSPSSSDPYSNQTISNNYMFSPLTTMNYNQIYEDCSPISTISEYLVEDLLDLSST